VALAIFEFENTFSTSGVLGNWWNLDNWGDFP